MRASSRTLVPPTQAWHFTYRYVQQQQQNTTGDARSMQLLLQNQFARANVYTVWHDSSCANAKKKAQNKVGQGNALLQRALYFTMGHHHLWQSSCRRKLSNTKSYTGLVQKQYRAGAKADV